MKKKHVTFLIVPEGSPKSLKFTLSLWASWAITGGFAFLLVFVIAMSVLQGKLLYEVLLGQSLKQENSKLRAYNARVVELEKELGDYKAFVGKVAELAGVQYGDSAESRSDEYDTTADAEASEMISPLTEREGGVLSAADSVQGGADSLTGVPRGAPIAGWITQGFSMDVPDFRNAHPGVDFAAKTGTDVKATAGGMVILAGWDEIYGNLVAIDHLNGYVTYYGHNSKNLVKVGDIVTRGQIIALSGNTGRSSAPHLHYEIRKDDIPINPDSYLSGK
jgi:murein DD-endopeptidase MepM/ murein hydrolase activator NlpD